MSTNASIIVSEYVNALTTAGWKLSDYIIAIEGDAGITISENLFSYSIRFGQDKELSGREVNPTMYVDFFFVFQLPLVSSNNRSARYTEIMTEDIEDVKDILRSQNVNNYSIIQGSHALPTSNNSDYLIIQITVAVEYCHNF